jgi:hypothetical protein
VDAVSVTSPAWAVITAPGNGFPADVTLPVNSEAESSDVIKSVASNVEYSGNQVPPVA